jgi:hypothetical protein
MKALLLLVMLPLVLQGQQHCDSTAAKGSYAHYGQPAIEDNSMLVDEAFNQPEGIIQHIAMLGLTGDHAELNYTVEAPVKTARNQLSISIPWTFSAAKHTKDITSTGPGDVILAWRHSLLGKKHPILLVPGVSIILPTGKSRLHRGNGAFGAQFSIALTKRWSRKLISHVNFGGTFLFDADFFIVSADGQSLNKSEGNVASRNSGTSVIWLATTRINLLLEYTSTASAPTSSTLAGFSTSTISIINPAFRTLIGNRALLIVGGAGFPLVFTENRHPQVQVMLYFSIEPF